MTVGNVLVLHNGVTWLNAPVSNMVQVSADRSLGGISGLGRSSLEQLLEVVVEPQINTLGSISHRSRVQKTVTSPPRVGVPRLSRVELSSLV